ncbi:vancomycin resistance protein [Thermanaeromonas sp. C210]|nr:vancomycin resistance protein [Thermanaeromonas sp. C210]
MGVKKYVWVLLLVGSLPALLGGSSLLGQRIWPAVYVGDTYLGGMKAEEGRRALVDLALREAARPVQLRWEDRVLTTTPGALGLTVDVEATLARALAVGRTGPWWERLSYLWPARKYYLDPVYRYEKDKAHSELEGLIGPLRVDPQDARLELDAGGRPRVVPGREGRAVVIEDLWVALQASLNQGSGQPVEIPTRGLAPNVSTEEIAGRRITNAVSSFTTYFNPSDENRTHNILLAAQALDGKWLKPGEEISFNELVGPRTVERGYREALVIEAAEFIPGVGGGVCQVSSTLYNAALQAGMTIVERQPHALKVDYVPPGLDATVAYGLIDLRLRNDTPYWYWLKAQVKGNSLTFTFYGPPEAPRMEVVSEIIEKIPPPLRIKEEVSLPAGKTLVEREGKPGYRVRVMRRGFINGSWTEERVSLDYYFPLPRVVVRGP